MRSRTLVGLGLLLLALLAACNSGSSSVIPLDVIHIQTSSALAHWLTKAADCTSAISNLGLASEILEPSAFSLSSADLILRLGERQADDPFTAVMGTESFVLVAGDQVPVDSLTIESLQSIFAGEWSLWSEVPEANSTTSTDLPLVLFSYPNGNELEGLFSQTYLEGTPVIGNLQRYSSAEGLATLLIANPAGLGYTLASQVPAGFRTLVITGLDPLPSFYVLAVTAVEPTDRLKQLLLCLQDSE